MNRIYQYGGEVDKFIGDVIAGVVGSVERQEFTVMGTPVNTAARLEGLCKDVSSPLVISERVQKNLDGKREIFIDKGEFKLRGKAHPERIFALIG